MLNIKENDWESETSKIKHEFSRVSLANVLQKGVQVHRVSCGAGSYRLLLLGWDLDRSSLCLIFPVENRVLDVGTDFLLLIER